METTTQKIPAEVDFGNLYPQLVTCFSIILFGYLSGRCNIISETESKGINVFTSTFVLPSLIFVNLVNMNMSSVNYWFLLAVLLSKTIVYFLVMVVHLLISRPVHKGKAGLFAVFATQSNDFAIGYPIVSALYSKSHADFPQYLYLMAPINLAILNPISYVLMESERLNRSLEHGPSPPPPRSELAFVLKVAVNVVRNPIMASAILGIFGNFVFQHHLPVYIDNLLEVLGKAFAACALFSLGMKMVGNFHNLTGGKIILPLLLILAKLLALPIILREMVNLLNVGGTPKDTLDWSTFGFLYGTLPSAPTVYVIALQNSLEIELIATSMVVCTFLSAPWLFVSAKMITLTHTAPSDYIKQLTLFVIETSTLSLIAGVWVIIVFALTKKMNKIPHRITTCLAISQMFSCVGGVLIKYLTEEETVASYIQFVFFNVGVYSTRIWTAILASVLVFMEHSSLCNLLFKLQPFYMVFGWGLPITLTGIIFLLDRDMTTPVDQRNPNFFYGNAQAIIGISLLVLCFVVTAGCLILHERSVRRYAAYHRAVRNINANADEYEDTEPIVSDSAPSTSAANFDDPQEPVTRVHCVSCGNNNCGGLPTIDESGENSASTPVTDIEDLFSNSKNLRPNTNVEVYNADVPVCRRITRQYEEPIDADLEYIEEETSMHDPQILRHTVLLICLLCSMFVGLAVSIWSLVMEKMSGIYIELAFIDVFLNFGQNVIIFAIFGTETTQLVLPAMRRWRSLWSRKHKLSLPMESELSAETVHVCDQFRTYHLNKCDEDIAATKRWRLKTYDKVFTGKKLVDWLIEIGLARDRIEAINYARHLIEGRVLRHINDVYHFYDKNLLYTFE